MWRGHRGTGRFPHRILGARAEVFLEKRGSLGEHGFPHATEPEARELR
jgi:hypothetical protein